MAVHKVIKGRFARAGHLLADDVRRARGQQALHLFGRQLTAVAVVVAHGFACGLLAFVQRL